MAGLPHFYGACMRPEARNAVLLLVVLLPLLGEVRGEDIVQNSNFLPSVPPNTFGRKKATDSRPLIVISTIDGGMHALEARTGALRWTLPSGDPVVNFAKPDEERRERRRPVQSELGGSAHAASDDGRHAEEGGCGDEEEVAHSESTEVARVFDEMPWQEEAGYDDFEGFIPVYSGIPGGGFLHMPEDGEWKVFERTAEQLVQLSPWYDKASRGIIVGSKETKVFALDPENGKMSWVEDEGNGAKCDKTQSADTLVITRSMYSIKVRHAETGAFFWNVSISEFRAHSTDAEQDPVEPGVETPLLVTSEQGNEVQAFDRSSGTLKWKYKLPSAAVSAHLWERKNTMEMELHSHDQAELVVASDSTALAVVSSVSTVHVHKHEGGMYARLYPPMRVPVAVAKKIAATVGRSNPLMQGALQHTSQLSTHVAGLSDASRSVLTKRNHDDAVCRPRSPDYPNCLVGTYDMSSDFAWTSPPIPGDPDPATSPVGVRGAEGSASQGGMWGPEFMDIVDHASNRQEQIELLLRLASQSPGLVIAIILFLLSLGWFLGRGGGGRFNRPPSGEGSFRVPRLSEASSSHSLSDLPQLPQLTQLIENGPGEPQSTSTDKDSGWVSNPTAAGEGEAAMVPVTSLDMSAGSWGNDTWSRDKSCTDSEADEIHAEARDQFPNELASRQANGNHASALSSKASSRCSSNSTAKAPSRNTSKVQARGKLAPTLDIPEPNSAFLLGQPSMKSTLAMLDESSSGGDVGRRRRRYSNAALSRDGSDDPDDESWAGEQPRPRSVSLGSHLSMDPSVKNDLDAALAVCSSAPSSPKTTPANGKAGGSPGSAFPQWNRSRYQKDFVELGRIGKGAFGSVYRVKQRLDEREYAVKKVRLDKDLTSADNQRIMREVKSFSILSDHPKIVRYYGTWEETEMPEIDEQNATMDSQSEVTWDASSWLGDESEMTHANACEPVNWLYIQMELCSTSLRQLLNGSGSSAWIVDRERIRRYLHDVSEGLSYIHEKHYIHRDMKPDNIFIVNQHGTYVAKLGDFGLSCQTKPDKHDAGSGDVLAPLLRDGSGRGALAREGSHESRTSELLFSGSISEEDMDDASLAELTRACGTRMYFSPELEHSGVYDQLVDVYALGIVIFEMMHIFKTGMERIKVIEQLKKAMCTSCANEFAALPIEYILVHSNAPTYANSRNCAGPKTSSKPNTPNSDKTPSARKLRAFERGDDSGGDSGADSPVSSPAGAQHRTARSSQGVLSDSGLMGSRLKPPPSLHCTHPALGSPGPASPSVGAPHTPTDRAWSEKMAGLLKGMALPSEVMDLFERFEFEVCLLLRLLSKQPDRRPSAQHMRDELSKSLPSDGSDDKGKDKTEVEKLRQELAELKKQNQIKEQQQQLHGKGISALDSSCASPRSPSTPRRGALAIKSSQSEADLRSLSMDGASVR